MTEHVQHSDQAGAPRAFFRPKPDGNTDPAGEAGWYLERERERRGLSLQVVSQAIGVHPHHLRAIELGMLENLPERPVALRMIGEYAKYLGFDPQPLVAHFDNCMAKDADERAFSSASIVAFPLLERLRAMTRTPGGITASVLTAVLLFGGLAWAVWPSPAGNSTNKAPVVATAGKAGAREAAADDRRLVDSSATVQEEPLTDDKAPTAANDTAARNAAQAADPIGALIASTLGDDLERPQQSSAGRTGAAQQDKAAMHGATSVPAADSEPSQRAARPQPPLHENAIRPGREVPKSGLALRAVEQIFLRLEDDAGRTWFTGFLNPGEVLALPPEVRLRLTAGDVHRLEWFANGHSMGRLARQGADFLSESLDRFYQQAGVMPAQAPQGG